MIRELVKCSGCGTYQHPARRCPKCGSSLTPPGCISENKGPRAVAKEDILDAVAGRPGITAKELRRELPQWPTRQAAFQRLRTMVRRGDLKTGSRMAGGCYETTYYPSSTPDADIPVFARLPERIARILSESPGLTAREIRDIDGISTLQNIHVALGRMEAKGAVSADTARTPYRYSLADGGRP